VVRTSVARIESQCRSRKLAQAVLHEEHRYPAQARQHVEQRDGDEPYAVVAAAELFHQPRAGNRLQDNRGRGEQPVRDDDMARGDADRVLA
jgi:hypothetical protein